MQKKSPKPFVLLSLLVSVVLSITFTGVVAAHGASTPLQYVALGDSLPFGYQPNNDFTHGYTTDLFQALQAHNNYSTLVNLSCTDDTTTTFINGDPQALNSKRGCLVPQVQSSNQLSAAVAYIQQHASATGLVTLQIGVDNFLNNGAINSANCAVDTAIFNIELVIVDQDLTKTILPQLKQALSAAPAHQAQLALIGYYNPLQQLCPNTEAYLRTFNRHLEQDARGFASFVPIDRLFTKANLCQTTWICTAGNIHPTDQGYTLIADRIYRLLFLYHRDSNQSNWFTAVSGIFSSCLSKL